MYSQVLVEEDILLLAKQIGTAVLKTRKFTTQVMQLENDVSTFFTALTASVEIDPDEDIQQFDYILSKDAKTKLFTLIMSLKVILEMLDKNTHSALMNRLESMKEKLYLFYRQEVNYVRYFEYSTECKNLSLCAVPKDLKKLFSDDLWSMAVPFILTSGTLAVNSNFDRTIKILGLEGSATRRSLSESTAISPFDYEHNCLLHLPNDVPPPDIENPAYLDTVAQKIAELVHATHGHTLVLFTSYKMMSEVGKRVQKQSLSFPLLIAWKDDRQTIGTFKEAENAVLFATGACWEGVDFPGDMVSSLIIVTLPFNVPDSFSKYEQSQYPLLSDFISASVVPDMQKKLKQGFGRAIRTETDTCVVTILDSRARSSGRYHNEVKDALPLCQITSELNCVTEFIERNKAPHYFRY